MATTDFVVKNGLVVNEDALIRDTTNSTSTTTGALVVNGGVGIANSLVVGGASTFNNNLVVTGDVEVQGGDLTTNQTTFNLVNATATTVNIAGAGTDVQIGSATGTTEINNNLNVVGDVDIDGGDLTASTTTFNLVNTTATTLNIGSAATTARLGANSGTLTLGNPTVVGTAATQNLYNTVATTLNIGGAATAVSIGAGTGTTTINNANTHFLSNIGGIISGSIGIGISSTNFKLNVDGIINSTSNINALNFFENGINIRNKY